MKRFTLIMAAIVCLAISAMAQNAEDQPLSPALWKQGIATCAHYTACDRRFGKKIEEITAKYPQGYTLDNLNEIYEGQGSKWSKIYDEFKKSENKGGSLNDLKEMVTPQVWRLVETDIKAFITDHPEIANAVPAEPTSENPEGIQEDGQENNAEPIHDARHRQMQKQAGNNTACPANLPLWLGIMGSLLGLCALLTALSNRGKINEMRRTFARELDRTNANLQEFSTDAADQMKALSIRLTGKNPRIQADDAPAVAQPIEDLQQSEDDTQPQEEQEEVVAQEDEREVMNLFMSRPDDDDNFTRVSDTFEPGNSIYVLTTFDGVHGTFEVIDKPEVHSFALLMPAENLMRACSGNAIQIPSGTHIVTDRAGEAEFSDGKWHVVVKAIIHYEG
jgi:hypothetical protein